MKLVQFFFLFHIHSSKIGADSQIFCAVVDCMIVAFRNSGTALHHNTFIALQSMAVHCTGEVADLVLYNKYTVHYDLLVREDSRLAQQVSVISVYI